MKKILLLGLIVSLLFNVLLLNSWLTKEVTVTSFDQGKVQFAFSDLVNDPKELLLEAIHQAEDTLDIAIYNFEDSKIAEAVLAANERGVTVRIITDATKAEKESRAKILDEFISHGIAVKINTTRKMHLKTTIVDKYLIVTGSYNFTEASANENLEQLLTLSDEDLAKEWTTIFDDLWEQQDFDHWS